MLAPPRMLAVRGRGGSGCVTARSSHVRSAVHADRDRGWGARLARDPVRDSKEAGKRGGGVPQPPGDGSHPPLCFSVTQRLLGVAGWGFHWLFLFQTRLEGEKKKKEKDQISVPLNCPGFVQPTVIVRLAL